MFSGGIGHVYDQHVHKLKPEVGWKIVRVGGPTYRLGTFWLETIIFNVNYD